MRKLQALFYFIYFYAAFISVKVLQLWFSIFKPRKRKNHIVYLELFGPPMAGYTARSKYWSDLLNQNGYTSAVITLTDYNFYKACLKKPNGLMYFQRKTLWKRILQCLHTRHADIVIVRRELLMYNDYGNLFMEKWMRAMHHTLVLDFDDDIAAAKRENSPRQSLFASLMLECRQKFTASISYYDAFLYGTGYLQQKFKPYIRRQDTYEYILPTCVPDFDKPLKEYNTKEVLKIGWVGTSYNLKNIESIFPALEKLFQDSAFEFILICDEHTMKKPLFPIHFIQWSQQEEVQNLLRLDIGLMPLIRNEASAGKSAFKLLQYMSVGIVPVASAVTINADIIKHGENGFLVNDEAMWYNQLSNVLKHREQFSVIGKSAYEYVKKHYSFTAHEEHYLTFINKLTSR
jgi:glycosyltransferase involved in cell wall biosynthesis